MSPRVSPHLQLTYRLWVRRQQGPPWGGLCLIFGRVRLWTTGQKEVPHDVLTRLAWASLSKPCAVKPRADSPAQLGCPGQIWGRDCPLLGPGPGSCLVHQVMASWKGLMGWERLSLSQPPGPPRGPTA